MEASVCGRRWSSTKRVKTFDVRRIPESQSLPYRYRRIWEPLLRRICDMVEYFARGNGLMSGPA